MEYQVAECQEADMNSVFRVISEAFGTIHPFINLMYPDHDTASGRSAGASRWTAMFEQCKANSKFLKICDPATGALVAQAKWDFTTDAISGDTAPDEYYWSDDQDASTANDLGQKLLKTRMDAFRDYKGEVLCLDYLTVSPNYQRRGLGRMLLQWGIKKADDKGVPCILECPLEAKTFYESEGFEANDRITLPTDYPKRWATKKTQEVWFMVRPAQ